ncbi:MAG: two-component sensor histidine kinase [Roseomonas sp.]|nr:two-component sensor histidine kinase [Roseomonas sp.]MCA3316083.1 two-component sensor histidine kinase [Roseomonas sp.]MCA3318915.1 two-component sensor histidine kinase [Roseomonas sp.]
MTPLDRSLRRLVPRGLLGRSLLIILVPLVILQAIALQVFYGSHLDVISRRLAAGVAGDIAMVVGLLEREAEEQDRAWIFREAAWRLDLSLAYEAGAQLATTVGRPAAMPLLPLEEDLAAAMQERVRLPFDADWQSDPRSVIIRVQMPDGVLHVEVARKRLFSGTIYLFVIWVVGSSLLLFLVAAIFMRNQVRALRKISAAAEAFGMGRTVGPMKPEGAAEVRQAATAFNRMEERIRRFVDSRTEMLAGISHDLRTPLTRLRLGLAMLPETAREDAAAMTEDVEEMDRLIGVYLAFARGEGVEQPEETDLAALLRGVVAQQARGGAAIPFEGPETLLMELRAGAMRRSFGNLLHNARKHAARVTVTLTEQPRGQNGIWADISIDDDGPGIPEAAREDAFKPFTSLSGGSTGLGLAIARDIARAHGGDVFLEDSPLGGLRARIRVPG